LQLDVLYGISKAYDYRPGSEVIEKLYGTGNDHAFDVKRAKKLVENLAVIPEGGDPKEDPKVIGVEQFQKLVQRTPMLISRIFGVQDFAREICGGVKGWRRAADDNRGVLRGQNPIDHEELENKIQLCISTSHNEDIFRNNFVNKRRQSFSHKDVLRVRRSESGEDFVFYGGSTTHDKDEDEDNVSQSKTAKTVSVYHHLDFGNPDENGRYMVTKTVDKRTIKRKNSYVANVGDNDFTGPAHAALFHQSAAVHVQRSFRGMQDRVRAKHLAKHELEAAQAKERMEQRKKLR